MMAAKDHPIIVVSGPTASGKSALALRLAECLDGWVINADSKQVYHELRILSARPTAGEEARVPHHLYGMVAGDTVYSAGRWLTEAAAVIRNAWQAGNVPVICGGSSLYLQALRRGLSPLPEVPPEIRREGRNLWRAEGLEGLQKRVQACDPDYWEEVDRSNPMRLLRAWEVHAATGKPLSRWQSEARPAPPLPEARWFWLWLEPERGWLYERIDQRFLQMMDAGVEAEIADLLACGYPADAPVMKAHGVPEFLKYSTGEWTAEQAVARAQQVTRNYAKRQQTWYRQQWKGHEADCRVMDPSTLTGEEMLRRMLEWYRAG